MILTDNNFTLYCAQHYTNYNCCDDEEFLDDLERFKYLKKLFTTYKKKGDIKDRLVMNHIVALYNVFEPEALTRILFFRLEKDADILVPFLKALNYLPDKIFGIKYAGYYIDVKEIKPDQKVTTQITQSFKSE